MQRRINKLALCALSALLLAGCGKKVSAEEANAFIKENYSVEKAKEKYTSGTFDYVSEVTKSEGIFESSMPVGKTEKNDQPATITPIAAVPTTEQEFTTYKISGLELTISIKIDGSDLKDYLKDEYGLEADNIKGSLSATYEYNEVGLATYQEEKIEIEFSSSNTVAGVAVSIEGAVSSTVKSTFTYVAA